MSGASLPLWARVGAHVVYVVDRSKCLGEDWRTADPGYQRHHIVREVRFAPSDRAPVFLLEGLRNPIHLAGVEYGYYVSSFRPLVSTKTEAEDVAEFRKLLTQKLPEAV